MSRAYKMPKAQDIAPWGTIEVVVLCDMHARRLTYEITDGRDIAGAGCLLCRTMTWDQLRGAHMFGWVEPERVFAPIEIPKELDAAGDVVLRMQPPRFDDLDEIRAGLARHHPRKRGR